MKIPEIDKQINDALNLELILSKDGQFQKQDGSIVEPTPLANGLMVQCVASQSLNIAPEIKYTFIDSSVEEVNNRAQEIGANAVEVQFGANYTGSIVYAFQLYKI